ncbi:MAG: hypothetical protein GXP42_17960, partial [Chloroflexi bacterium]|nr:hypothetical protein [Chloroflexota bacterium]
MHLRIHLHRFSTLIFLLPLVLLGAWLLAPGSQAQSGRCYVNASASGGVHDGATWATAYLTLQDALADAGCTEIW